MRDPRGHACMHAWGMEGKVVVVMVVVVVVVYTHRHPPTSTHPHNYTHTHPPTQTEWCDLAAAFTVKSFQQWQWFANRCVCVCLWLSVCVCLSVAVCLSVCLSVAVAVCISVFVAAAFPLTFIDNLLLFAWGWN